MMRITAHCLVKNEENFIAYAVRSVIDFVDQVLIFDTGSTDRTVAIIKELQQEYPQKIVFEEKGECDKKRHTELRQEMVERTSTEWFMVLDGDEVWSKEALVEVVGIINSSSTVECLVAPFYLCVGDVKHEFYKTGQFNVFGHIGNYAIRFFKKVNSIHWAGEYESDSLFDSQGKIFFQESNTIFLKNRFWHLTHLKRSSIQRDYSSGKIRFEKVIPTYFFVGRKICDNLPEEFKKDLKNLKIGFFKSLINFVVWSTKKLMKSFGTNQGGGHLTAM